MNKIAFVTNMCTHYVIGLFERLASKYPLTFYFTGGHEWYWEKKNQNWMGQFEGTYLKGFFLTPRVRFTPGLMSLTGKHFGIFIKTLDDRFSLPFVYLLSRIQKKPFILWTGLWHHPKTFFHSLSFGLTMHIYKNSEAIVVYGRHVKEYLIGLGIDGRKIFVAPHSVDNSAFNQSVSKDQIDELKIELGISDRFVALYVGRMEESKGVEYLIESMSQVEKRGQKPILLMVGDGSQKSKYEEMCRESGVDSVFVGYVKNSELYRYYASADVMILPSITTPTFKEPWGLVVNEAMNQGCPVIATDAVGAAIGGLVEDGKTGYIVPERNSKEVRRRISILKEDTLLRSEMIKASKDKIGRWNVDGTVKGFQKAIEFVL